LPILGTISIKEDNKILDNPFEKKYIKNYVLLYVSIVVIMILFFIATSLFHDVEKIERKEFKKDTKITIQKEVKKKNTDKNITKFKLLDKTY